MVYESEGNTGETYSDDGAQLIALGANDAVFVELRKQVHERLTQLNPRALDKLIGEDLVVGLSEGISRGQSIVRHALWVTGSFSTPGGARNKAA
jgi:hypothetical protein